MKTRRCGFLFGWGFFFSQGEGIILHFYFSKSDCFIVALQLLLTDIGDNTRWQGVGTWCHPFQQGAVTWAGERTMCVLGGNDKKPLGDPNLLIPSAFCQTWPLPNTGWEGFSSFCFVSLSIRHEVPFWYVYFDKCPLWHNKGTDCDFFPLRIGDYLKSKTNFLIPQANWKLNYFGGGAVHIFQSIQTIVLCPCYFYFLFI